ncbi:hypothetical protein ACVIWV_000405 [Bradyrhizobium diazoefficiens]|uniref:hypothetical protein n=1 Tax=Bradyrhizobium TaxID=374 RepID=UPI001B8B315D|nr:hypothetical protein [Bradyrhizobium diazoefficiens]MBR0867923.1 hypothetical protein [Bradyrhizobium diazoefficiens]MBR0892471.1 hypothetical protein [Bradyrhizobium diazoefficiens]MBR0923736.1 hypothetical protein [Bradyrhizobium diazoefficiens]
MIVRPVYAAFVAVASVVISSPAAADALASTTGARQSLNATAIAMFLGFVAVSLVPTFLGT